jgi:flavodoxin
MKNYKVVYFTRTGTSKRVADKIAQHLHTTPIKIMDHKKWGGVLGYIRAGFYSTIHRPVHITLSEAIDTYDIFIVVSPLWAGQTAPAVCAFFKQFPKNKTHLVVTSIGSVLPKREDYLSVTDIVRREQNEDLQIQRLIEYVHTLHH